MISKKEGKRGISFIILIVTIVIALILIATIGTAFGNYIETSRISKLANEVSQIQDGVTAYYLENGVLPVVGEAKTKEEVISLVDEADQYDFEQELDLNGDDHDYTQFYTVDLNMLETEGNVEDKEYICSYPNFIVYDITGMDVNFDTYFSISPRIDGVIKINKDKKIEETSTTSIKKGSVLKVTSNTLNSTNKMGINVNAVRAASTTMYLQFTGISGQKEVRNNISKFNFDTLEDLNAKDILTTALTQSEIDSFNNSLSRSIDVVINDLEGKELARETVDVSNFDTSIPTISIISNKKYTEMRILRVEAQDSGNNIKEIRYDFLERVDGSGNVSDYYPGVKSFDKNYMLTKAKTISANEFVNNQADIKIPDDVGTLCVASVDSSGNISTIIPVSNTNGIACNITDQTTGIINSANTVYDFVFSEEVVGFTETDLTVVNGTVLKITGSGNIYQVVVKNPTSSNQTQSITLNSAMCSNVTNTKNNYEASLQVKVNTINNIIAPQGISLNKKNITLKVGAKDTLLETIAPANVNDNTLEWKSDDEEVVTVSEKGEIVAKDLGTAIITVKTVNNKTASCKINVTN